MKKSVFLGSLPLWLLFSLLPAAFTLLVIQVRGFSILSHSFRPQFVSLVICFLLFFLILLVLWALYSRIIARLFSIAYDEALSQDFLTWLPLVFLSLTPLALRHYISADDLATRLEIFAIAAIAAVFYLKLVRLSRLSRNQQAPWRKIAEGFSSLPLKKRLVILFVAALVLYNLGSLTMISKGIVFSGDEPHYLIITHSLLQDGDFDLANNYARHDYARYMIPGVTLRSHVVTGMKPGGRYSSHSPGVSLLLLPFYALGSLFGGKTLLFFIRFGMSLFGAFFGLQIFLFARSEWKKDNLALLLWLLFSFTSPVYFYAIHVYPEIVVALLSFTVFRIVRFSCAFSKAKLFGLGLLLSLFFWFHALKYIFILIPLFIYSLWAFFKKAKVRWNLAYFFAPVLLISIIYFYFQYSLYGSFSPFTLSPVSWQETRGGTQSLGFLKTILFDIPFRGRWETLSGYFLDQKDGLLFYAPVYFFAFLGAVLLLKRKPKDFLVLVLLTAPYFLNSAFLTQRTGYAPQARPLLATFWGWGILLGYFLAENRKRLFSYLFNFVTAVSFLFVYLLLKSPLNLYQETTLGTTERGSGLFYLLSNLHFQFTSWLPSYIKVEEWRWLPNFIWPALLILFIVLYVITREHSGTLKFSSHVGLASAGLLLFFVGFALYPRMVLLNPVRMAFPSGEKITFYSLSRVARMKNPGEFLLPEDNRPYHFFFTSWREVKRFRFEFGSLQGNYSLELTAFDSSFFKGKTEREIKDFGLPAPPAYPFKKRYLYWLTIHLSKGSGARTDINPYLFSFSPSF